MKKIDGKKTSIIGLINILSICCVNRLYKLKYGYGLYGSDFLKAVLIYFTIAILVIIFSIVSIQQKRGKKMWAVCGIILAIMEIVGVIIFILVDFCSSELFGGLY